MSASQRTLNKQQTERWAPWLLLLVVLVLWQVICSTFDISEFIFFSPWRIWTQLVEYKSLLAGHAWRTY